MSRAMAAGDVDALAVAELRVEPFRLPLRRPLATARARLVVRSGVLLTLVDADGLAGYGEASPFPGFHRETAASCLGRLERLRSETGVRRAFDDWCALARDALGDVPAARSAVDGALHDLRARRAGRPLAATLAASACGARDAVAVNALVSEARPEAAAAAAREAVAAGFGTLKLKLRVDGLDRERVAQVRAAAGPDVSIRLDANGAWSEATARRELEALSVFDVELVEQPLPPGRPEAMARLRERAPIPIAADEDAVDAGSVARLIELGAVDWLVVKPSACGGPGPSLELARRAARAGIGVVVTSLVDGAVGRATALHLAAALDPPPPACGLATGGWLARDLGRLPAPRAGRIALPAAVGIGVEPTVPRMAEDTSSEPVAGRSAPAEGAR
jgi:o-succinylbenzoate synthase